MSNLIRPSTFINGSFAFWSYENDGKHRNAARINEAILLQTGALSQNQTVTFNLQLGFHFEFASVWADNTNANSSDTIAFTLKTATNTINTFSIPIVGLPSQMPTLILDGTIAYLLDIRPTKSLDNLFLYIKFAQLIDNILLTRI